jgi:hypothetical protein
VLHPVPECVPFFCIKRPCPSPREGASLQAMQHVSGQSRYTMLNNAVIVAGPPSWEFEVSGRLIERAESEGATAAPPAAAPLPGSAAALGGLGTGPRFGSLIRRLTIRLDPEQYPMDGVVTWSKALHEGPAKEKFSARSAARSPMQMRPTTARLGSRSSMPVEP